MLIIPTAPVARQTLTVTLAQQACTITVYTVATGMYLDLYVNNAPIITGVICQDANKIVRDAYLGFVGDLSFFDTQGDEDPVFTGLGSRWYLYYLEAADL